MLKVLYQTILIACLIVFLPSFCVACSCARTTVEQVLKDSTTVFVGKVSSSQPSSIGDFARKIFPVIERIRPKPFTDIVPTTFDVARVWKGQMLHQVTVTHGTNGTSCGVSFKPGVEYLVYAFEWKGELATGMCARTTELSHAQEDLKILGSGMVIPQSDPNSRKAIWWALGTLLLLTFTIWLIAYIRNRGGGRGENQMGQVP